MKTICYVFLIIVILAKISSYNLGVKAGEALKKDSALRLILGANGKLSDRMIDSLLSLPRLEDGSHLRVRNDGEYITVWTITGTSFNVELIHDYRNNK